MISPEDPRHGLLSGWAAGCLDECCMRAKRRYDKRWQVDADRGIRRIVGATGTRRRIQALQAIGWPTDALAAELGLGRNGLRMITSRDRVRRSTAVRVAKLYQRLWMTEGPSSRVRVVAQRKGWLPPMAWDDIDHPGEGHHQVPAHHRDQEVDRVVVDRALTGVRVKANEAEKAAITASWEASGGSLAELCRIQGWNVWRDRKQAAA